MATILLSSKASFSRHDVYLITSVLQVVNYLIQWYLYTVEFPINTRLVEGSGHGLT